MLTGGWNGYNFLSRHYSLFTHSVHNQGHGYFCLGLDSTSHIEQLWFQIKSLFEKIYYIIPKNNYVIFLRKMEFRIKIKEYNNQKKFCKFFRYIQ